MGFKSTKLAAAVLAACAVAAPAANAQKACLIVKNDENPYFAKMEEAAEEFSDEIGVRFYSHSGKSERDNEGQVRAVNECIGNSVDGILIAPANPRAIIPSIRRAREAKILVIAVDSPLSPNDEADSTIRTDNFQAGYIVGQWARGSLGDRARAARIAMLNLAVHQPMADVERNQGFLQGFGINLEDRKKWGDENDARIVGQAATMGTKRGGRSAMKKLLEEGRDINVVYTYNELVAAGAHEALESAGLEEEVLLVSVGGGCPGVRDVMEGVIGATAMVYPDKMAEAGLQAVKNYADYKRKPLTSTGKDYYDTGSDLITDRKVSGLKSIDSEEATFICWDRSAEHREKKAKEKKRKRRR